MLAYLLTYCQTSKQRELLPLKEFYRNDAAHKRNQKHYNYWNDDVAGCKTKACVF